jgi:membrane-bound lytic murein transglycosylase D
MIKYSKYFYANFLALCIVLVGHAQNNLTISDNPVAVMLDSLANQKIFDKAFSKPFYPKTNKYKYTPDSVPRFDEFVYENRLAKLDAVSPFDLVYNPHVKGFIDLYAVRRRELVSRMMGLAQLYYPMFEEVLDKHNLPLELKHLAVVESALNPNARSKAGAVGLWQFMYPTGKMYGLNVNSYVDERSNVYKATEAAAEYLKSLYGMFGDWQMVLAAYNAGPGNISKAIRRSGGKKTYWEIRPFLPLETQSYVPAFIAANYIMSYPAEHNIYSATPKKTYFEVDTVVIKEPMTFQQLSLALDISVEEIAYFNPQYRKQLIPSGGHFMTLPKAKIGMFVSNEEEIYAAFKSQKIVELENAVAVKEVQKTHVVKSGQTLAAIAKKYGVTVADLKSWNYIGKSGLKPGKKLVVYIKQNVPNNPPTKQDVSSAIQNSLAANKSKEDSSKVKPKLAENNISTNDINTNHKVKKGETLYGISKKYNIPVDKILEYNKLGKNAQIQAGQTLKLTL